MYVPKEGAVTNESGKCRSYPVISFDNFANVIGPVNDWYVNIKRISDRE